MPISRVRRWPGGEAAAEKLLRRGYLSARDVVSLRKTRTQKIVAWNPNPPNEPCVADHRAQSSPSAREAEARIREVLASTRGPLPLALLLAKADVSRAAVQRLEKSGALLTWEEPLTHGEDPWDTDFVPPANVLNAEQKEALEEIWRWIVAGQILRRPASRRHRQRQNGGLPRGD